MWCNCFLMKSRLQICLHIETGIRYNARQLNLSYFFVIILKWALKLLHWPLGTQALVFLIFNRVNSHNVGNRVDQEFFYLLGIINYSLVRNKNQICLHKGHIRDGEYILRLKVNPCIYLSDLTLNVEIIDCLDFNELTFHHGHCWILSMDITMFYYSFMAKLLAYP